MSPEPDRPAPAPPPTDGSTHQPAAGSDQRDARSARPDVSRRRFLGAAAGAAAVAAGGWVLWEALLRDSLQDSATGGVPTTHGTAATAGPAPTTGRVLVVVQLGGGNDGLNTLVPAADGRYFDARRTLGVKESDVVALTGSDRYGLNPALRSLAARWEAGQMAAVDSVGFPGQSRSHFSAMDTWWSAQPGAVRSTGWLGRWLDATMPSGSPDPLRAIALGAGSPALVGERATSTVVLDPATFSLLAPRGADPAQLATAFRATAAPLSSDSVLAAAQGAVPDALRATDLLARAVAATRGGDRNDPDAASGPTTTPPTTAAPGRGRDDGGLAGLMATAAGIVELGIGTQVIVVGVSGFDTHADQAQRHPRLLTDLADGVGALLGRAEAGGWADRLLVMTTSEFGRRVVENGSGTDHGDGGVQFVFGAPVNGARVVGEADLGSLVEGDLRSTVDSRSLYAAALRWLDGGDTAVGDAVLGGGHDTYDLVR